MRRFISFLALLLLGYALYQAYYWLTHRPKVVRGHFHKHKRIKQVAYCPVVPADYTFKKRVLFWVEPYETTQIKSRLSSKVVWINPKLFSLRPIQKGEPLFRLERSDFELDLIEAKAQLQQARLALEEELQRARRAKIELTMLSKRLSQEERDYLLRKPFVAAARANLEAARAKVRRAQLMLKRCEIKAPYPLWGMELTCGVGDVVSPSTPLLRAVRADRVVGRVLMDPKEARFVDANSTLRYKKSSGSYLGSSAWVEEKSKDRYIRFLFKESPLLIGSYLEGVVFGKRIDRIAAIRKEAIGFDGALWYIDKGRLKKMVPECLWEDAKSKYCKLEAPIDLVLRGEPYFFEGMRVVGVKRCE